MFNITQTHQTTCSNYANCYRSNNQHDRRDLHDHLNEHKNLHFDIEKYLYNIWNWWGKWSMSIIRFANHLALVEWFISYKKWVQRFKIKNWIAHVYLKDFNYEPPKSIKFKKGGARVTSMFPFPLWLICAP